LAVTSCLADIRRSRGLRSPLDCGHFVDLRAHFSLAHPLSQKIRESSG